MLKEPANLLIRLALVPVREALELLLRLVVFAGSTTVPLSPRRQVLLLDVKVGRHVPPVARRAPADVLDKLEGAAVAQHEGHLVPGGGLEEENVVLVAARLVDSCVVLVLFRLLVRAAAAVVVVFLVVAGHVDLVAADLGGFLLFLLLLLLFAVLGFRFRFALGLFAPLFLFLLIVFVLVFLVIAVAALVIAPADRRRETEVHLEARLAGVARGES
ncbi:hypothetical protein BN1708_000442, partial [Verticillium longisporum]